MLEGVTSRVREGEDLHYLFFDIDSDYLLDFISHILGVLQKDYTLSNFYIFSDSKNSYRVFCFNEMPFRQCLKIWSDLTYFHSGLVDWNFVRWSVFRGEATLRISSKKGRPKQKLIKVLESYYVDIPKRFKFVEYETYLG